MAARRYEISLLVLKKYFTRSLRSLVKYFSTLGEKFRISVRPCNILYVLAVFPVSFLFAYSTMLTHINASFANHSFDCIIGKFVGGNFWTLRCLACWKVVIRINTGLWKEKSPLCIKLGSGPLIFWGKFCTCAVALKEWPAHKYYTLHPLYWCPRPLNRGVRLIKVSFTVNKGKKLNWGLWLLSP